MTRSLRPLGECLSLVIDRRGVTPTKLGSNWVPSGHRVLSAKHIKKGTIDLALGEDRFVDDVTYARWMSTPLLPGDVLLTSEAPLGEAAYVAERLNWCLGQRLFGLRPNPDLLDGRFLFYLLQHGPVADAIQSRASGTTVQGIRQTELVKVEVPLLPPGDQRAVARLLGALDDKIELNRRMNETLEAMARAIFKSWFVDFDPVRAKAEGRAPAGMDAATAALFPDGFEESELGEVPRGWAPNRLGGLVDLRSDRVEATPAKDGERYVALDDMPARSIDLSTWRRGSEVNSSIIAFNQGDILFGAMRPYFHKVGLAQYDGITRTTTFVIRAKDDRFRSFLLFLLSSAEAVEFATTHSVGTTIPYVRWDAMEGYRAVTPPPCERRFQIVGI